MRRPEMKWPGSGPKWPELRAGQLVLCAPLPALRPRNRRFLSSGPLRKRLRATKESGREGGRELRSLSTPPPLPSSPRAAVLGQFAGPVRALPLTLDIV